MKIKNIILVLILINSIGLISGSSSVDYVLSGNGLPEYPNVGYIILNQYFGINDPPADQYASFAYNTGGHTMYISLIGTSNIYFDPNSTASGTLRLRGYTGSHIYAYDAGVLTTTHNINGSIDFSSSYNPITIYLEGTMGGSRLAADYARGSAIAYIDFIYPDVYNINGSTSNCNNVSLFIKNSTNWYLVGNKILNFNSDNYNFLIKNQTNYKIVFNNIDEYEFFSTGNITYNYPPPITPGNNTYTNHTAKFDELFSVLTVWSFITIIFGTYEFYNGATLFWLVLIMIPYTMMWVKQGSVIIPATMALLSGSILFTLVPAESIAPIKILLTVGIAGIFYHIIKSR